MSKRRVQVSYQTDEGFQLYVTDYNWRRYLEFVGTVADFLSRTRLTWWLHSYVASPVILWIDEGRTDVLILPIQREDADKVSREDAWGWLDDE